MIYNLLNWVLNFITKRGSLILINLGACIFSLYCLKFLFVFIHGYNSKITPELLEQVNNTFNGIADVLVTLGVFMECRITIQNMTKIEITPFETHLNEIAEHNGMGLLLIGLCMEIITCMIDVPNEIFDTRGLEIYFFYGCFFLISCSILVELDLMKDYIKTYFKKARV